MQLFRFFLFLFALNSSPAFSQRGGGQEVGNGGDPLQLIFRKARVDAVNVVKFFAAKAEDSADIPAEQFDRDVLTFLTRLYEGEQVFRRLIIDIENSEHLFIDPELTGLAQSTCARTNLPDSLPGLIRFSLPHCRMAIIEQGEYLALKILIHEASHHFGVGGSAEEEDFAWRVAEDLFSFWIFSQQQHAPIWQPLPLAQAPIARYDAASTSFGEGNVLVWGGCNFSQLPHRESCEHFLDSGSILTVDYSGSSWHDISEVRAPSGRKLATASYTGIQSQPEADQKVIVFGGY